MCGCLAESVLVCYQGTCTYYQSLPLYQHQPAFLASMLPGRGCAVVGQESTRKISSSPQIHFKKAKNAKKNTKKFQHFEKYQNNNTSIYLSKKTILYQCLCFNVFVFSCLSFSVGGGAKGGPSNKFFIFLFFFR